MMRSLRAVWTVLKREVYAFFVSPMAYVLLTAWLLWCGLGFWMLSYFGAQQGGAGTDTPLTSFFGQTTLFYLPMLVFVPLVTMRLLAEEKSRGTIELLLTAPVSKVSVVVGKYLASLVIWSAMWLPTLLYVWLASRYGGVDAGATLASYVGVLGIGVYYMAIGLFMSSLVRSQIVAAILTFLALGTLFMLGLAQYVLGDEYRELFAYVSIWGHMESFSRGVIDSRYLVFNGSLGVLGLVLTVLVMRGAVSARDLTQILRRPNSEMRARGLGVLNVVLVLALAAQVNYLNFRHYERWDWTEQGVYTLSDRTIAVLEGLNQPVEIWVLVSEVEPGFGELRNVLGRYGAESEFVEVEYVDPDRDPGRYREAATRFGLGSNTLGSAQGPDVAVVVVAGERQWEVRRTDLFQEDYSDVLDDEGQVTLNVDGERAITGALVELMSGHATKVCVVSGHGEFQVSGSGRSLTGFAAEMRRENLEMESIETRGMTRIDDECDAVAVIGPEVALTQAEASLLRRYVREGGNLLVALDPIPNPDQTALVSMGVDGMLRELGVRVDRTIVIEPNPALLPAGGGHPIGPFAVVGWGDHPITEPFGDMGLALVVSEVRSVRLMSEERGTVLLTTSEQSYAESNLASLSAGPTDLMPDAEDFEGPVPIAVALQVEVLGEDETGDDDEEEAAAARPHGGRLVVIGDATLFASEYLQQDTVVNRSFASGVMGWLTERDALLAIEARTIERQPFTMSQDDIVNLFLRVVVLIPLAFIFLGIAVWWNRRN